MTGPDYYSVRRLCPVLGTLQIVSLPEARAYSGDGVRWKVELLSQASVRLGPWGDRGPASAERRFFTFGYWTRDQGLERVPVNAILGDQSGHPALEAMVAALGEMPAPPFPPGDRSELWLLDGDDLPLALLRSQPPEQVPPIPRMELSWRAQSPRETGFPLPAEWAEPPGPGRPEPALILERQVHDRAGGAQRRAQWFRRGDRGNGFGLGVVGARVELMGRELPAAAFPPLLLAEDWPKADVTALVGAYLDWAAPYLLTLPMDRERRSRLERAACARPELLYRYRHLLPEVIQKDLVDPALVQAVLKASR